MSAVDLDPMERFMATAAAIAHNRDIRHGYGLYEYLKRDFVREFPSATPAQYEAAITRLARLCGV